MRGQFDSYQKEDSIAQNALLPQHDQAASLVNHGNAGGSMPQWYVQGNRGAEERN